MKSLLIVAISSFLIGFVLAESFYDNPPEYHQTNKTKLAIENQGTMPYDDPFAPFKTSNLKYPTTKITWKSVKNVHAECDKIRAETGSPKYTGGELACATWSNGECTIVTDRYTNMGTVGHEIRHCFFGNWHKKFDNF